MAGNCNFIPVVSQYLEICLAKKRVLKKYLVNNKENTCLSFWTIIGSLKHATFLSFPSFQAVKSKYRFSLKAFSLL